MKVLLTGAFGNVGLSTLEELLKQGHPIRCFDLKTRANQRTVRILERKYAHRFEKQVEVTWGDLRRPEDVTRAVRDQEVVIHLAFIIPKLSATGFESEDHPDWAWEVNVGGTANLLEAIKAQPRPSRILFASSYHIYGRTHDQPPPRTVSDPVQPIEHYARHKVECEERIRSSGLEWAILRLAASLPIAMRMDPGMFDVPLENRMEYVYTRDAGLAFANAASSEEVWGKILLIGGGTRCQHTYREIAERVLDGLGVGMLPEEAFSSVPFPTDWLDTAESQRILCYQRHTLDDYVEDMKRALGHKRHLASAFRPLVRFLLLKQSPYYHAGQPAWFSAVMQGIKMLKGHPTRLDLR